MKMFESKGKRHEGGGHDPSLMALGVLGVMMMAAVIGVVVMDDEKAADAAYGDEITVGDLIYKVDRGDTVRVIDTTSHTISGDLVIPSTITDGETTYTVTMIYGQSFVFCSDITSITIPETVQTIDFGAFGFCYSLKQIHVDPANPYYSSENGIVFNKDHTVFARLPSGFEGEYSVPDGITTIGDNAFDTCTKLTSVTLPESITSIEDYAFNSCLELAHINIPDGVTFIDDYAFMGCSKLTSIDIPDGITTLEPNVFNTTGIESIVIPESVTSIGSASLSGCRALTSITIPESVTSIGSSAFTYCDNLTSIIFEADECPALDRLSFDTGTTVYVTTPGWNPVEALADAHGVDTTIIWANPPYPTLTFESDPVADGIIAYITNKTS